MNPRVERSHELTGNRRYRFVDGLYAVQVEETYWSVDARWSTRWRDANASDLALETIIL